MRIAHHAGHRALLMVFIAAALCFTTARAQEEGRPIRFFLTFVPNIQFSPIYVAIEKGYFAEAGLDVSVEHGDEPDGVNLIAAGERQFGMISGEQVLAARANQRPVVYVYAWFHRYPVGIVVAQDGAIDTPEALRGRKVGIPGLFGASYTGLTAFLAANGLTEADIRLESIGFNAPQVFCIGGVEASTIYINNEPLQIARLAERGECGDVRGVRVFRVADYANMVSNGIVTNEETLRNDPQLVEAFVLGFHRGLVDTINNPAEAYLLSLRHVESLPREPAVLSALSARAEAQREAVGRGDYGDQAALRVAHSAFIDEMKTAFPDANLLPLEILVASIDLWTADSPGATDLESWEATQETLLSMGLLRRPVDLSSAFTNDYVPKG